MLLATYDQLVDQNFATKKLGCRLFLRKISVNIYLKLLQTELSFIFLHRVS
ncbi:hypothetical protein C427_3398 [Paraglaciecola psychrophila 170]|uniref:Uncharacterized protein n=1 Tax=Paraglaciecola psychrophila 170 TaxID=1129794 RepID=K7ASC1_9ALTE|nr:hypothetical protein C427_3398 [Paraglaciecola psychrophila 170]GAC38170.1 hypothetical protein GPSY_2556 [Paraglaciecola psychrophila 170]